RWRAQIGAVVTDLGISETVVLSSLLDMLQPADGSTVLLMVEVADNENGTSDFTWTLTYEQKAIYVDLHSVASSTTGSPWNPVTSLGLGMTLAAAASKREVRVTQGEANPSGTAVQALDGVSLRGGYTHVNGIWERDLTTPTTMKV